MCRVNQLLVCIFVILCNTTQALQSDHDQPMIAASGSAQLFQASRIGFYRDHVVADQGSTELTANQVIVRWDEHNQVDSAIALGKPANFSTLPHLNGMRAIAHAQRIEYYPKKNQVILLGDASITQNQDVYHAEKIYYDTVTQVIQTPKQAGQQVTIVFKPKSKSGAASVAPSQNNLL